jgi:hypothetical protein
MKVAPLDAGASSRIPKRARGGQVSALDVSTSGAAVRSRTAQTAAPQTVASAEPASPKAPPMKRERRDVVAEEASSAAESAAAALPAQAAAEPRLSLLARPRHTAPSSHRSVFLRRIGGAAAAPESATSAAPAFEPAAAPPAPPQAVKKPVFEKMLSARGMAASSLHRAAPPTLPSKKAAAKSSTTGAAGGSPSSVTSAGSVSSRSVSASRWAHVAARTDTGRRPSVSSATGRSSLGAFNTTLQRSVQPVSAAASAKPAQDFEVKAPTAAAAQPGTFDRHVSAVLTASAQEALARAASGDLAGALALFATLPATLPAVTSKALFWVTRAQVLEEAGALPSAIACLVEGVASCREAPPAEQDAVTQALAKIAAQRVAAPSEMYKSGSLSAQASGASASGAPPADAKPGAAVPEQMARQEAASNIYMDDLAASLMHAAPGCEPLDVGELIPIPRSPPPAPLQRSQSHASPTFAGGDTVLSVGVNARVEQSGIYSFEQSAASAQVRGFGSSRTPSHAPPTQNLSPSPPKPQPSSLASSSPKIPRSGLGRSQQPLGKENSAAKSLPASPLPASPLPVYIASASRSAHQHAMFITHSLSPPISQVIPTAREVTPRASCAKTPGPAAATPRAAGVVIAPDSLARQPQPPPSHRASPKGSLVLLRSVSARKSCAEALGTASFLSPVRRSARLSPRASNQSLQDASFAWRGNDALPGVSLRAGFYGAESCIAAPSQLAASYLNGPMSMGGI